MIPQYVHEVDLAGSPTTLYQGRGYVNAEMIKYVRAFAPYCPDFSGTVQWQDFKKLGAMGDYAHFAKKKPSASLSKLEKFKQMLADKKAAAEAAHLKTITFQIMPGLTATKIERAA